MCSVSLHVAECHLHTYEFIALSGITFITEEEPWHIQQEVHYRREVFIPCWSLTAVFNSSARHACIAVYQRGPLAQPQIAFTRPTVDSSYRLTDYVTSIAVTYSPRQASETTMNNKSTFMHFSEAHLVTQHDFCKISEFWENRHLRSKRLKWPSCSLMEVTTWHDMMLTEQKRQLRFP